MKNKKIFLISTITIFLTMFLFHQIYDVFPNFLTAAFFPVNESLFEHLKLMYVTEILVDLVIYLILKLKHVKYSNYLLNLLLGTIITIITFFLIYLPIYNRFGENLIITMILYLITLIIGKILACFITKNLKHNVLRESLSYIIINIIFVILIYFTFNPLNNSFFFDALNEVYGIYKK